MQKNDAIELLAKELCKFFDTIQDMPKDVLLRFSVDVTKVEHQKYHIRSPQLVMPQKETGLILPATYQ